MPTGRVREALQGADYVSLNMRVLGRVAWEKILRGVV